MWWWWWCLLHVYSLGYYNYLCVCVFVCVCVFHFLLRVKIKWFFIWTMCFCCVKQEKNHWVKITYIHMLVHNILSKLILVFFLVLNSKSNSINSVNKKQNKFKVNKSMRCINLKTVLKQISQRCFSLLLLKSLFGFYTKTEKQTLKWS